MYKRALELLSVDPALGGVICVGFRPDSPPGRRIPPHAELTGYATPWGWQPGLLDADGVLCADLDILSGEAQALLAQRLDRGGCTLVAHTEGAPWAHLADRVAFLLPDAELPRPPQGKPAAQPELKLAAAALQLGVASQRAEWFALRTAKAIATAAGRRRLYEGDLAEAIALVLMPRATVSPQDQAAAQQQPQHQKPPTEQEAPVIQVPTVPLPPPPVQLKPSLQGTPIRSIPGKRRRGSLDLLATLLAALPWQKLRGNISLPPAIRSGDLRWHLRKPRQGRLIIFGVDASGSMGARRLGQAKGAVLQALHEAYRRRDQVALVAASGQRAKLMLPPARAVEQARRRLVGLPVGGATPLGDALLLARRLAIHARRQDGRPTLLVLLTDGRANQPLPGKERSTVREDLRKASLALRKEQVEALVLGEPGPEALELARWLGGRTQRVTTR